MLLIICIRGLHCSISIEARPWCKTDIKSAYRQVPVHPHNRHHLGLQWQGHYIDTVLPFGLCSAAIIFSAIAEALELIVRNRGVELIFHYIDNFGPPQSETCEKGLLSLVQTCASLAYHQRRKNRRPLYLSHSTG